MAGANLWCEAGLCVLVVGAQPSMYNVRGTARTLPPQQRTALVALYEATFGKRWLDNDNWLRGDPCSDDWEHVACGSSSDGITGLCAARIEHGTCTYAACGPTISPPRLEFARADISMTTH